MYIKILVGAYGHRPNPNQSFVEKKDCTSEPFEVNDKEAARLIGLGIAKEISVDADAAWNKGETPESASQKYDNLEQLSIQQLRKMVKDLGLPADGSKAALAEKIRNASSKSVNTDDAGQDLDDTQGEEDSDDMSLPETPPVLQAAEPEV